MSAKYTVTLPNPLSLVVNNYEYATYEEIIDAFNNVGEYVIYFSVTKNGAGNSDKVDLTEEDHPFIKELFKVTDEMDNCFEMEEQNVLSIVRIIHRYKKEINVEEG